MDENTTITVERPLPAVVLTPKPVRFRAEQDRRIENDITETARRVAEVQASPTLLAFAQSKGFDAARLAEGVRLVSDAQSAYTARQTLMGTMQAAADALEVAYRAAYDACVEFRETVRIPITDRAGQQALAVTGNIPRDADNFLTRARAGVAAARKAPYAAILSKAGYDDEGLSALESLLNAFAAAKTAYANAVARAIGATRTRDDAYTALRTFSIPLHRLLRLAARKGIR